MYSLKFLLLKVAIESRGVLSFLQDCIESHENVFITGVIVSMNDCISLLALLA